MSISQMIDFKRYVFCCSGRGERNGPLLKRKAEQAPALQMEFSIRLIIPEDRGESRKSWVVGQFPICALYVQVDGVRTQLNTLAILIRSNRSIYRFNITAANENLTFTGLARRDVFTDVARSTVPSWRASTRQGKFGCEIPASGRFVEAVVCIGS